MTIRSRPLWQFSFSQRFQLRVSFAFFRMNS